MVSFTLAQTIPDASPILRFKPKLPEGALKAKLTISPPSHEGQTRRG
jgi:hypothetical protein